MEKQTVLNLVKMPSTYKLVIPEEVERKIRHLCQRVPNVEWSGTLFFTHEGSMEDGSLVITCKDIFVMDIGSVAYTEFDMSPEVISYMCDKPELLDMQMGLIHSHNNMSTFFSDTDTATLKEEGRDRNHFVSLIVNNAGTYTAAITRRIKSVKTINDSYSYGSFNDETVSNSKGYTEESEYLEYYLLDITKEGTSYTFNDLDKRLDEIRKRKAAATPAKTPAKGVVIGSNDIVTPKQDTFNRLAQDVKINHTPSLFSMEELRERGTAHIMESEPPRVVEGEIPFTMMDIPKEDIDSVLLQLLTGSLIVRDPSKIDLTKWVNSMPKIFGDRFGVDEPSFKTYQHWADAFQEFLIGEREPDNLTANEEADYMASFAANLYQELDALPQNRYIEILKSLVEQWI